MAVRPETLDNPERGMDLKTRGPKRSEASTPESELKALRQRLEAAKGGAPQTGDFARGWMSAVRAIEGEG